MIVDPLVERACERTNTTLRKHNIFVSMFFLLRTFRQPPAILLNGALISQGEVLEEDEFVERIQAKMKS